MAQSSSGSTGLMYPPGNAQSLFARVSEYRCLNNTWSEASRTVKITISVDTWINQAVLAGI